jgi:hypothetical protein
MRMVKGVCGCARCTIAAVTGPVLVITLGVLLAASEFGWHRFRETWPVLLIVYGATRAFSYMAPSHGGE